MLVVMDDAIVIMMARKTSMNHPYNNDSNVANEREGEDADGGLEAF